MQSKKIIILGIYVFIYIIFMFKSAANIMIIFYMQIFFKKYFHYSVNKIIYLLN